MGLIKTKEEIEKIREASRIVSKVHRILKENIKIGVRLIELDKIAEDIIRSENAIPAFLGFQGFPNSICSSVNNVMVHGIPSDYQIKDGDIVSIDVGVKKNGYYGDGGFTIGIGNVSPKNKLLMDVNKQALLEAIKFVKPGISLGELGKFIENFALKNGFTSSSEYGGHGIGKSMHEDPYIPNIEIKDKTKLKEGMTICIEPMFIDGPDKLFVDPIDNWTVRTVHGGFAVHDEHTILITANGAEILTKE